MKIKEEAKFRIHLPDQLLMLATACILIVGFLSLSSAASGAFLPKQLIFFSAGIVVIFLIYKLFNLEFYHRYATWIYWLNIALLLAVKVIGFTSLGAQRWIRLGPISIQPSEIAKICLIIALAAWLSKKPIKSYWDIFVTLFIVAIPAGLVFLQPDLGTTLVYAVISFGMLFWAGANLVQLLILVSPLMTAVFSSIGDKLFIYEHSTFGFAITMPVVIFFVFLFIVVGSYYKVWRCPWRMSGLFMLLNLNAVIMVVRPFLWGILKGYQQKRLTIFLDPSQDPLGAGYHIIQSLYAIGSGGVMGKGYKAGQLTQGNFVPEQHTDFIFSVSGEEFGLIGTLFVLLCYAVLCIRIIRIAKETEDYFSSLVLVGIFSMFIFHIFVNIGMNLSLMPITGVPLPLMSYGGTSLLVDLFLIAVVLKVAAERDQYKLYF